MQQEKIPTVIIIGTGLSGLTLYHSLTKDKDEKKFNVKIFERDSSPQARWQGHHIALKNYGVQSLLKCIPPSVASNLPKAVPDPIPNAEFHGITITDHTGALLLRPPSKQVKNIYEVAKSSSGASIVFAYRDKLRDVLLENVPVQWSKKFVGYEETEEGVWALFEDDSREFCDILVGADGASSLVRKQKVPELQFYDYGITLVYADVSAPKHLTDKLLKIHENYLGQATLGLKGDVTFIALRSIPIENYENKDEPHYRTTITISYPTKLDDVESVKIDDGDSASIVEHVKRRIRELRPECELTDVMLELWGLVPTTPNDSSHNVVQRKQLKDINPLSVNTWKSSRVTLIGDAAHAVGPVLGLGANNAIQDADILSHALLNSSSGNYISCVEAYESVMKRRRTIAVLGSRAVTLINSRPVGYFDLIIRNTMMRFGYLMIKITEFVKSLF